MRRAARLNDPTNTLSVAQLELLSSLAEHPGSRPGHLARRLQLRPNSVTTLVNGLEAQRLLARSGSDTDRRAVSLALTPAGERAVQQWQSTNAAILGRALNQLPPATRSLVSSALPGLSDLVEAIESIESMGASEAGVTSVAFPRSI
jgi:DNA-binding MarR family transcriptional regulator